MTGIKKMSLIVLGTLAAMFMIAQLVMGLLLAGGQVNLEGGTPYIRAIPRLSSG